MKVARAFDLPQERHVDAGKAVRLEWISIGYLSTVIVLMYLVMGSSQTMKTAWVEDILSLTPPLAFLVAERVRNRPPSAEYPWGRYRAVTVAFLIAAAALLAMGVYLLVDGATKLFSGERPSIGSVEIFGHVVWQGWVMLAVLVYAIVPVIFLGRAKTEPARRLHDKTLYADAAMNRADWLTGLAAVVGVLGVGAGLWWADAAAAIVIAGDVTLDGLRSLRSAFRDVLDHAPRTVDHRSLLDLPVRIEEEVRRLPWVQDVRVRLRENGRTFTGDMEIVAHHGGDAAADRARQCRRLAESLDWHVHDLVVEFVDRLPRDDDPLTGQRD